jgi:galactoside O-acetyltransferase
VVLEDFSGLSQGVKIYTHSDDYSGESLTNPTVPRAFLSLQGGAVSIGRHAIIGAGSVILPGADIGEGTAVGALSLVTKPLEPWGIYAGVPARRLKDRSRALLNRETELLCLSGDPGLI